MANKYELVVVLSPALGEEGYASVIALIKAKIESAATIEAMETIGVRRMAYEIKDHKDGYYLQFNFTSEPDFPKEVERIMKITEGVLRYLVIRVDA